MTDAAKREAGCICGRPHQDFCPAGLLPPRPAGDAGTDAEVERLFDAVAFHGACACPQHIPCEHDLAFIKDKAALLTLIREARTAARQAREETESLRKQLRDTLSESGELQRLAREEGRREGYAEGREDASAGVAKINDRINSSPLDMGLKVVVCLSLASAQSEIRAGRREGAV